jgi:hypothetical protein
MIKYIIAFKQRGAKFLPATDENPLCSQSPAGKSRDIWEPRFEVKDFFKFLVRLALRLHIFPGKPQIILYPPLSALKLRRCQLCPEQVPHLFIQFFVGQEKRHDRGVRF